MSILTRIQQIYKNEGFLSLVKRAFKFLLSLPFEYKKFHLYITVLGKEKEEEADWLPRIKNFTYKDIEGSQQLKELLNQGFDLSLLDFPHALQRLENGAVVSLFFVDKELAYNGWLAFSEEAKNSFDDYHYKVDFSNGEACSGDNWTNPKYRRRGILYYAGYKRRQFLMKKGIYKIRWTTLAGNEAMHNEVIKENKLGVYKSRRYAKARSIRIFGREFWKETPVS